MKKAIRASLVVLMVLATLISCASTEKVSAPSGLDNAKNYLFAMYKNSKKDVPDVTASDYTVVDTVMISGISYSVDWTVDCTEEVAKVVPGENHQVTIDVNEKTPVDALYNLTATVKDNSGNTASVSFARSIPQFKELSWDEYIAAATDSSVVVKGVVSAIMSKTNGNSSNCLYIQDNVGGYYIYGMSSDPVESGIKVGMTVRATGIKDLYSGTHEVKSASIEILDANSATLNSADWTEKYSAATSLKDAALTKEQGLLVTVKDVEISSQDTSNGYYKFKKDGLESYVRISSSVCPLSKADQEALKKEHADHFGWIADVTGVICVYDGAFYLTPVDSSSFVYKSLPEKSDKEKVSFELENISLETSYTEDTTVSINTTGVLYDSVSLSWSSDNSCVVVDGDKMVVTLPENESVVTVTVVATSGLEKSEKTFTLNVDAQATDIYKVTTVTEVKDGDEFKYHTYQALLGQDLYFTGEMSGKYLATSNKASDAVTMTVEMADGGFYLSFVKDGEKKYLEVLSVDGKATITLSSAPSNVWTINEESGVPVTSVDGTDYYLGSYKTYNTLSASKTSYILGDNLSKIGESQFPAQLKNVELGYVDYTKLNASTLEYDKPYLFVVGQKNASKLLHFTGEMSGKYLASGNYDKAEEVYLEKKDGGFAIYFMAGESKKYVEVLSVDGKATITISDSSTSLWTINEEAGVPVTSVDGTDYYLGCYKTYETFSASKTSYILGDSLSKIGESQFPAYLCSVSVEAFGYEKLDSVEEGKAYALVMDQNLAGKTLFFTGEMSGKYLASTPSLGKSAYLFAELTDNGFKLYTVQNGERVYLSVKDVDGKATIVLDNDGAEWTINTDAHTPVINVSGTDYYVGSYKTYETFSASKTSYILGESLSKIGESQFPAYLSEKEFF